VGAVAEVARAVVGFGRGRVLVQDSCQLLYCCSEVCLPLLCHWGSQHHRSKATHYRYCCEQERKDSSLTHGCKSSDLGGVLFGTWFGSLCESESKLEPLISSTDVAGMMEKEVNHLLLYISTL